MKIFVPAFLIMIISIPSCRKDDAIETLQPVTVLPVQAKVTDYYPLTVGSYWIYDVFRTYPDLTEQYWMTDTTTIVKDTMINGKKFYLEKGKYFGGPYSYYVSDSLDYIVASTGVKLFSHTNFTDTLRTQIYPSWSANYYKMVNRGSIISVPAGILPTLDLDDIHCYSVTPPYGGNPRVATRNFARNVGMVRDLHFFDGQPECYEKRLVQYHIAQ